MGTKRNVLVGVAALEFRYPVGGDWAEVGYTEDGVTLTYSAEEEEVRVEEKPIAVARIITGETVIITCNMAESSLTNIDKAMAGALLSASTITLGGGVNKEMSIQLTGVAPDGGDRTITIPLATANGAVGMGYRKGGKTIVPVSFEALDNGVDAPCTMVDS